MTTGTKKTKDPRKSVKIPPELHEALHELRHKAKFTISQIQQKAVLSWRNGNLEVDKDKKSELSTYKGKVIKNSTSFRGDNALFLSILIAYIEKHREVFDITTDLEPKE